MTVEELAEYLKDKDPKATVTWDEYHGDYTEPQTLTIVPYAERLPGYLQFDKESL